MSSRLLTSKSSLMDSHQHPFFVQPVLQRRGSGWGGGQLRQVAVGQRMHLPHGAAEQLALYFQPAAASRRAVRLLRSRCSRNWRVMVARSCRPSTRTPGRRGLGALRGLGTGAGVSSARGVGAVRVLGLATQWGYTARGTGGGGAAGVGAGWAARVRAKAAASAPVNSGAWFV